MSEKKVMQLLEKGDLFMAELVAHNWDKQRNLAKQTCREENYPKNRQKQKYILYFSDRIATESLAVNLFQQLC